MTLWMKGRQNYLRVCAHKFTKHTKLHKKQIIDITPCWFCLPLSGTRVCPFLSKTFIIYHSFMFDVAYCSVTVFDEVSQMQVFSFNAPYGHHSAVAVIF